MRVDIEKRTLFVDDFPIIVVSARDQDSDIQYGDAWEAKLRDPAFTAIIDEARIKMQTNRKGKVQGQ